MNSPAFPFLFFCFRNCSSGVSSFCRHTGVREPQYYSQNQGVQRAYPRLCSCCECRPPADHQHPCRPECHYNERHWWCVSPDQPSEHKCKWRSNHPHLGCRGSCRAHMSILSRPAIATQHTCSEQPAYIQLAVWRYCLTGSQATLLCLWHG